MRTQVPRSTVGIDSPPARISSTGTRLTAGTEGRGSVVQGSLEGSNVQMVNEMVNLMVAQRGYEASVKVVQAADEMLGMVNNLRK